MLAADWRIAGCNPLFFKHLRRGDWIRTVGVAGFEPATSWPPGMPPFHVKHSATSCVIGVYVVL
jgi:hypothetical protein